MTAPTKQQVIAFLEALRPAELRELLHELEERWGVERLVLPQAAAVDFNDIEMGIPEFDLVLLAHGGERIAVMKLIRAHARVSLRDAKRLLDSLPQTIAQGLSHEQVGALREQFEAVGARVEIR